jgi:hypothetical protein
MLRLCRRRLQEHCGRTSRDGYQTWLVDDVGGLAVLQETHRALCCAGFDPIDDKELSGRAGQSRAGRECDLSNLGAFAVQFGRINCPAGPDKPLLPPLPLKTSHQDSNAGKTPSFSIETRQARIRAWLTTDALALRYAADVDALERLIPPAWRFAGYGHFIAREIRALVAVADCPEGKPPGIAG